MIEFFSITGVLGYIFLAFITPVLVAIIFGIGCLIIMSSYIIYVFFIRAPFRGLYLWKEGKIQSSYTRSKELWYKHNTWKGWFLACLKSDIETLKTIINF